MAHSSPEPAACLLGEGVLGGACRRTPCAERAVSLTAVQSLRLLVRRGEYGGREYGALRARAGSEGGRVVSGFWAVEAEPFDAVEAGGAGF